MRAVLDNLVAAGPRGINSLEAIDYGGTRVANLIYALQRDYGYNIGRKYEELGGQASCRWFINYFGQTPIQAQSSPKPAPIKPQAPGQETLIGRDITAPIAVSKPVPARFLGADGKVDMSLVRSAVKVIFGKKK